MRSVPTFLFGLQVRINTNRNDLSKNNKQKEVVVIDLEIFRLIYGRIVFEEFCLSCLANEDNLFFFIPKE